MSRLPSLARLRLGADTAVPVFGLQGVVKNGEFPLCPYCRDPLFEDPENNSAEALSCGHLFHLSCLRTIYDSEGQGGSNRRCPICFEPFSAEDTWRLNPPPAPPPEAAGEDAEMADEEESLEAELERVLTEAAEEEEEEELQRALMEAADEQEDAAEEDGDEWAVVLLSQITYDGLSEEALRSLRPRMLALPDNQLRREILRRIDGALFARIRERLLRAMVPENQGDDDDGSVEWLE